MKITSGIQKEGGFDILSVMRRSHLWKILQASGVTYDESTCDLKRLKSLIEGNSALDGVINFNYKDIVSRYRNSDEAASVICSLIVENIVEKKRKEFKKATPTEKPKKAAKQEKVVIEEEEAPAIEFPVTKFRKKEEVIEDNGLDIE